MRYFRKATEVFLMIFICVIFLLATVAPASAAIQWSQINMRFSATAGETLATGDVVCIKGTDGLAYKGDPSNSVLRPIVGVVGKGGATGKTVEIVTDGIITGMTKASPGARLYATIGGAFTTSAPTTYQQVIGWVLPGTTSGSTTYYVRIYPLPTGGAGF
jgi:hypothetical protein